MVMNDKVTYWMEMSDYDFDTANAMFITGRYLYVGFMCHHSLSRLAEKSGLDKEMSDDQLDFIDELKPLNIEARYPSYKERLMRSLNTERCKELIRKTDDLRSWIKNRL